VLSTDLYGLGTTLLFLLTKRSPADLPQRQLKINFHAAIELPKHFADWLERMIEPVSTTRFASVQEALAVLQEKQALPPRTPIYQKPKNSAIHLTKADGKLVIDIRATLVNSQLSLGLRLLLLFGTVFSWAISYGWIAEVLEPWLNITPGMELMFRLYVLLLGGIPIVGVCLVAATAFRSLLLKNPFRTRLEIDPKSVQIARSLGFWRMDARLTSDPSRFQNSILQISLNQHQFPLFKRSYSFCTLQLGTQKLIFGLFLRRDEQAWLVNEIRTFVERHTIVAQQIKKI